MSDFTDRLMKGLGELGIKASAGQAESLERFAQLLLKWNKVYNLTAIRSPEEVLSHHLLDCAAIVPHLEALCPGGASVLDVGSGGGLPSVPLAVLKPDWQIAAVDAVKKKTVFLTQAAITLKLRNFKAYHARVETLSGNWDLITSRAFSCLADFVRLTDNLLSAGGRWAAMKGAVPREEIAALPQGVAVEKIIPLSVPGLCEERHLIVMRKLS
jgi:16S rRNA (guanine527-N7)-methyltransferase